MNYKNYFNFIEEIIEKDINQGLQKSKLKFRFPPEPNGYLHIGHAKAIFLNFGLGIKYGVPVNLRFDDTNPLKIDKHFIEKIKEDIQWLGFMWDKEYYTSNYFDQLYKFAQKLIKKNKAYVDDQSQEIINFQRKTPFENGISSPYRNRSIEENLDLFEKMKKGFFKEGTCVLRAKIDMSSNNMNLRDPIMYRILKKSHHNTECLYPTYDWSHGQSDYIEQISHSLCSLEFENHRPLYDWFLDQIIDENISIRPKQLEFSRLNISNTIISKRKINFLIEKKIINDWDDPRLLTLNGLRSRGYTSKSIYNFCKTIGITKRENIIDISLLEFNIRKDLNKIAYRVMVVLDPIQLIIDNYPIDKIEWFEIENNPHNINYGKRKVPFSKYLYIEREDFREKTSYNFFRLSIGSEVRLKNSYIIKAINFKKDNNGKIIKIHCIYDSTSRINFRKTKSTLHWVSIKHCIKINVCLYEQLFNKLPDHIKNINYLNYLNNKSLKKIIGYGEPNLKYANIGIHYQFQRLGYFYTEYKNNKLLFNRTVTLINNQK
ncbi:MAG: glutamine--tRNA ligase [Candidatus Bostrichicola ureolyticus]|nr:MAG: glutamine--tRNA ligase [Candidatus Bostrichicola ureolyticus]